MIERNNNVRCMHSRYSIGKQSTAVKVDKIGLINLHGCALRCVLVCCWFLLQLKVTKNYPVKACSPWTNPWLQRSYTKNFNRFKKFTQHPIRFCCYFFFTLVFIYLNALQKILQYSIQYMHKNKMSSILLLLSCVELYLFLFFFIL